ncbi:hypothetical protein ACFSKU_14830 [Pontibacter silvestris]|uniref:Uncharacterized protein n=1 Tax=Pontibacter silvestris TaxID=2305183 RepID=A0ABW4X199_9BACT|nr:hypothetical protein [Pontibacter silvestris]MCC9138810.1 hypothetical protein [Pontibacter silvestris]
MYIDLKELALREAAKMHYPLFYNFIIYNELLEKDENYSLTDFKKFNERLDCDIEYQQPSKLISKIINFNEID